MPRYAQDDDLLATAAASGQARLRVAIPGRPIVVLGRGSDAAQELDLQARQAAGVPLLRRRGGGCSVLLDPGDVLVSLAAPRPAGLAGLDVGVLHRRLADWLLGSVLAAAPQASVEPASSSLGPASASSPDAAGTGGARHAAAASTSLDPGPLLTRAGVSDLVHADRKCGGTSLWLGRLVPGGRELLYFSASLLVDPAVDLMERCLRHPPREPAYRRGRPHRDFVRGLALIFPGLTAPGLATALESLPGPPPTW